MNEEAQACESLKARTYGPADGSSEELAGNGPRSKGIGRSNLMTVDEGEYSSSNFVETSVASFAIVRV